MGATGPIQNGLSALAIKVLDQLADSGAAESDAVAQDAAYSAISRLYWQSDDQQQRLMLRVCAQIASREVSHVQD